MACHLHNTREMLPIRVIEGAHGKGCTTTQNIDEITVFETSKSAQSFIDDMKLSDVVIIENMFDLQRSGPDVRPIQYKKHTTRKGDWYIPVNIRNPADELLYDDGRGGGFGNRELQILLDSGQYVRLKGPWQSNPTALKEQTSIDLTDKHLFSYVLTLSCTNPMKFGGIHSDVIYYGIDCVGEFHEPEHMAKYFANKLDVEIYGAVLSAGGSRTIYEKPGH